MLEQTRGNTTAGFRPLPGTWNPQIKAAQSQNKATADSILRCGLRMHSLPAPPDESRRIIPYVAHSKLVSAFGPLGLYENMTSSTKQEVHNLLHYRQSFLCCGWTKTRPQVTCSENFVKFRCFLDMRADRQTAGTLIAILRTPHGRSNHVITKHTGITIHCP